MFFYILVLTWIFYFAFQLRFDFEVPQNYWETFISRLPMVLVIKLIVFWFFGLYSGVWRYVNAADIWSIAKANVIATVLFVVVEVIVFRLEGFPRVVLLLDCMMCIGVLSGARIFTRLCREYFFSRHTDPKAKRILIVGAGESGVLLLGEYRRNPSLGTVVGFIDDDRFKLHTTIHGVNVLGDRAGIPRIVDEHEVAEIVLALPSANGETVRDVLSYCERTTASIKVLPGLTQIISGKMELKPRSVQPDDLLGRETVSINNDEVALYLKDRIVLVTGAGGSIGSEICRQVALFSPREIILFDHHENYVYFLTVEFKTKYPHLKVRTVIGDIRDVGLLKRVFSRYRPQVVFHAAAHKHVPLMEESPTAAVKNNVFGTRNMIYACQHYHVERFVLISTDKAVNPINIMGMSKRIAEMILQLKSRKASTKFMAVRFGNVLGSAGSVVPLFKRQIENGGPITVTHPDVKRYFMSIHEAVMLVLQAGALGKGGELFILDMGEQIKVVEIAKNLIALSGLSEGNDIEIKFTGLRPGEKLEEELLLDKERDSVTQHQKIFISHNNASFDAARFRHNIKQLHRSAELMDLESIMKLMREIIDLGRVD